ncbi:MAG: universal stress protein [Peptococcaceae bacterium]|nr:universal stress protein [Peptococcaceae bacterium]
MFNKILLPTDGSEYSMRAARFVLELLRENPNRHVTVLKVYRILPEFAVIDTPETDIVDTIAKGAHIIAENTAQIFRDAGFEVETDYCTGDPGREICRYAKKYNFDHIVIGHRGAGSLSEIVFGSVARRVVKMAPCSVTVVK